MVAPLFFSFQQAREDLAGFTEGMTPDQLWARPFGEGNTYGGKCTGHSMTPRSKVPAGQDVWHAHQADFSATLPLSEQVGVLAFLGSSNAEIRIAHKLATEYSLAIRPCLGR